MSLRKWIVGVVIIAVAIVAFVIVTKEALTNPGPSYFSLFAMLALCHVATWKSYNSDPNNHKVTFDATLMMSASWLITLTIMSYVYFNIGTTIENHFGDKGVTVFFMALIILSFYLGYHLIKIADRTVLHESIDWDIYKIELNCTAAAFTILAFFLIFAEEGGVFKTEYYNISNYFGTSVCFADVLLTFIVPVIRWIMKNVVMIVTNRSN